MPLSPEQILGMRKLIDHLKNRILDCETVDEVAGILDEVESKSCTTHSFGASLLVDIEGK